MLLTIIEAFYARGFSTLRTTSSISLIASRLPSRPRGHNILSYAEIRNSGNSEQSAKQHYTGGSRAHVGVHYYLGAFQPQKKRSKRVQAYRIYLKQ